MTLTSFILNIGQDGTAPTTEFRALPKYGIYLMSHGTDVIRIGECSSGVSRFRKGFRDPLRRTLRGKDRKNYIAYSWRDKYKGQAVKIDYFELFDQPFEDNHFRRALEAEITFQFRFARKAWPLQMSEIHFLERFRKDPRLVQVATAILKHYGIAYNAAV